MQRVALGEARVCVLYGGRSGEREVSLATGRAVLDALPRASEAPASVVGVEIDPQGRWVTPEGACAPAAALEQLAGVDVFFLGLHGGEGENGGLQGMLAMHGLPHTGSAAGPSALGMDKEHARRLARSLGLRTPEGRVLRTSDWEAEQAQVRAELERWGDSRRVVKPRRGGSSVATRILGPEEALEPAVEEILALGDEVLLERAVDGVELTCPVLGNRDRAGRALTPVEVVPDPGRFFDYEQKYDPEHQAQELCPPVHASAAAIEAVRRAALDVHECFRLDGYSRTDFLLPPDSDEPVFLEVNTLPGLTPQSIFPKSAAHDGLPFAELCAELVRLALAAPPWCVL